MDYFDKAKKASKQSNSSSIPALVVELLDAATKLHVLHLIVRGDASYAQHKALNEIYDALPDLADNLAESWQGATMSIPDYPQAKVPELNTVSDALNYIDSLKTKITKIQKTIDYSEIVNDLDTIKTQLNSTAYKLKFLA